MQTFHYTKFLLAIVRARLFSQSRPLVVGLNVTNRCNLRCTYCYGDYSQRREKDFSKEQLLELIEKLSLMGTRMINIGGGEPLLRQDIGEVINKIKAKNMLCFMNSNGLLVPEKIKQIKRLDGLTISLDGDEQGNDSTRGQGTFKKIIRAIEVAKNAGLAVSTNTVINRNNLHSLDALISLAQRLGYKAEFNLPYEQQFSNNKSVLDLEDNEIKTALKRLVVFQKKGAPLSFSIASRQYALSWPLSYKQKIMYQAAPSGFKITNCYMGRLMCLIEPDGLVYPCGQLLGRFPALNLHRVGLEQAWGNLLKKRTCKSCYCICFTEFNQLFGLKPRMLFSTAARFFKRT